MALLEPAIWFLLAAAIMPIVIAARLGNLLERAAGLAAMQVGLAAWLVAAAIAQMSQGDERWLAHALAIAVPACFWIGARQWRDVPRPWAIPAIAAVPVAIADLSAMAHSGADAAIRDAIAGVVLVHACATGCVAVADLVREGVARSRSQQWFLLTTGVGPPLLTAVGAALRGDVALALDPLTYLPLAACLAWILRTYSAGISGSSDLLEPLIFVDGRNRVVDGNAAAFALLGVSKRSPRLLHGYLVGIPGLRRLLDDPSCECGQFFTGANADARRCYEARVIRRPGNEPWQRVIAIQDVTARQESERLLLHQARFDSLTGLANRRFFLLWLEKALAAARSSASSLAVMYLDLDRFKSINDTYGHSAGDELLRIIAHRLRQRLRGSDAALRLADPLLARLGGDEFALLLPRIAGVDDATGVATWLLAVLAEPVMLDGKKIWNAGSAGIAIYPDHAQDVESLLRSADIALYHAKKHRRGGYQVFDFALTEATQRRASIDRQLRGAIESNAFAVHYQPKYGLRSRKLQGAEALLRWQDAELGTVAPKEFIPVAEESGLIRTIGESVLETVCGDMERWRAESRAIVPISINVSSRQFAEADMNRVIADALTRHGLDPRSLEIELTESSILENDERTAACLREIRAIGVRVSLDDFGTGYSSLSYLNRVPLDLLKIDHCFVRDSTSIRARRASSPRSSRWHTASASR